MESKIKSYANGYFTLDSCEIKDKNFKPKENELYRYIELADIESNGFIRTPKSYLGRDLPTRARRLVRNGDVIISSIEGSLESCALITKEFDNCLVSTGFYVLRSRRMNAESLLMLFRSSLFQEYLKKFPSGTILTAISKEELQKILIPQLDSQTQEQIAKVVANNFDLIQKAMAQLMANEESLGRQIFSLKEF